MSWRYLAGPCLVAVVAMGCSSEQATVEPAVVEPEITPSSLELAPEESTTTTAMPTVEEPATTTVVADDIPTSMAFSSARDIGKLFETSDSVSGRTTPSPTAEGVALQEDLLVVATKVKSVDGELWVQIRDEAGADRGWVKASELTETQQTIDTFQSADVGQLRTVRSVDSDGELKVLAVPGNGSVVMTVAKSDVVMHGGNTARTADGQTWIDIIDPASRSTLGWTLTTRTTPVAQSQVRTAGNEPVPRRGDPSITYGATLPEGQITAVGCNATQITIVNSDQALGLAIVFGTSVPTGRQAGNAVAWSASGGSKAYLDPTESVTFTLMTDTAKTWYFAALDADGQAASGQLDADGVRSASNAQAILLPASVCGTQTIPDTPVEDASSNAGSAEQAGEGQSANVEQADGADSVEQTDASDSPVDTSPDPSTTPANPSRRTVVVDGEVVNS